jgi:hypothetical protein
VTTFDPPTLTDSEITSRVWEKTETIPWSGCYLFTGAYFSSNGGGRIMIDGKQCSVHREMFEIMTGRTVPAGTLLKHKCGNSACWRPEHLRFATERSRIKARQARELLIKRLGYG